MLGTRSPKSATATIVSLGAGAAVHKAGKVQNGGYVVPHPHVLGHTATWYRVHCGPGVQLVVWSKQSVPLGGRAGNQKVCGPEPVLRTWIVIIAQGEIGVLGIRMICCGNL